MNTTKPNKNTLSLLSDAWPLVWELVVSSRWGSLAICFLCILVGRLASLVAPSSTAFLVDNILLKHQPQLLGRLLVLIIAAALVQSACYASVAHLLSSEGHK